MVISLWLDLHTKDKDRVCLCASYCANHSVLPNVLPCLCLMMLQLRNIKVHPIFEIICVCCHDWLTHQGPKIFKPRDFMDGLVQDCSISIVKPLEVVQS